MYRMLICLLLLLRSLTGWCQGPDFAACISSHIIDTDTAGLTQQLTFREVPQARFFLLSELHNININPVLQLCFIQKLQRERGLRHIILEMPHSYAFRYNKYLETGADSLLYNPDIRHAPWLLQQLRAFNHTLPDSMQLQFTGIDLCIGTDASGFKTTAYRTCMTYFYQKILQQAPNDTLRSLLQAACELSHKKQIAHINRRISILLNQNETHYRQFFNKEYKDLAAIVAGPADYKGSRDDEMLHNFERILSLYELDPAQTTFFASFGETHTNPTDGKGMFADQLIAYYTTRHLPDAVCLTGVQYFNTTTGAGNTRVITNDGIVRSYGSYKKKNAALLADLEACQLQLKHQLGFLNLKDACPHPYLDPLNYLILCKHYTALNP